MSVSVIDSALREWVEPLLDAVPGVTLFDAHTHLGEDVDGTRVDPEALLASLLAADARAVTFALHDPAGLSSANAAVLEAARLSDGRLVAFCRLDPHRDARTELERCVEAGARGVKLHPRAERFTLAHPGVEDIFALAHELRLPLLVHAGRGIAPLGDELIGLARRYPRAPVILAHAAIADLAWLPEALDDLPSIFFDTAWWNPVDLLALFALIPPSRILFGSDTPYGDTAINAAVTQRCAQAVGLGDGAIRSIAGQQLERMLAGEPLAEFGPAPGGRTVRRDLRLDRVATYLAIAWGQAMAGAPSAEPVQLARHALALPAGHEHSALAREIDELLSLEPCGPRGLDALALAVTLAVTLAAGIVSGS